MKSNRDYILLIAPIVIFWLITISAIIIFDYLVYREVIFYIAVIYYFVLVKRAIRNPPSTLVVDVPEEGDHRPVEGVTDLLFAWTVSLYIFIDIITVSANSYMGIALLYFSYMGGAGGIALVEMERDVRFENSILVSVYFRKTVLFTSLVCFFVAIYTVTSGNWYKI